MAGIHTLDARGNFMLPLLRKHYGWSDVETFEQVQLLHAELLKILQYKGIQYIDLRAALTPQTERHESAFLFDSRRCGSRAYGAECGDALVKLLDRKATHSILVGDLIDRHDAIARELLADTTVRARDLDFAHPSTCYVIYVNNLSDGASARIHEGLKTYPAYLGYVPCSYASVVKTYFSMCLMNVFIKHKGVVLMGHEDDRPNSENCNLQMQDFEALGLKIKSLQMIYFSTFLAYKPERMFLRESDDDLDIALRSMSKEVAPIPLTDFRVLIEENKFDHYLKKDKLGKLTNAGLDQLTRTELEEAIRQKLRSNYVYNMEWVDEPTHRLSKFNVLLEFPKKEGEYPERLMVALEYKPEDRTLRLLTAS